MPLSEATINCFAGTMIAESSLMIVAHFTIDGEERETRVVPTKWLHQAWENHENVLLRDGLTYEIVHVDFTQEGHARVDVRAPLFARGG